MQILSPLSFALLTLLLASCAEGSNGEVSRPVIVPPPPSSQLPPLPGLVAAAAGSEEITLSFILGKPTTESALFLAGSLQSVATSPPIPLAPSATQHTFRGLTNGSTQFIAFGIRDMGATEYERVGPVLSGRPDPPIYVDAARDPAGTASADGLSPQTAFADVTRAVLTAFVAGGGNVWVAEGEYEATNLPLFGGVHVYGGFDRSFDLESRDPSGTQTHWNSIGASTSIGIQAGMGTAVLDGVQLMGLGVGTTGIDIKDADVELRCVTVSDFLDRGIKARAAGALPRRLTLVRTTSSSNGADGLSVVGPFHVVLDQSRFVGNVQEGVECGPLEAPDGGSAALLARGCEMRSNGNEGLDLDLSAPLFPGTNGGFFDIRLHGCTFDDNVLDGALIDVDYETVAGYSASIEVTNITARANQGSGLHVDLDAPAAVFIHASIFSANALDGILVSSESDPGLVVCSSSVMAANLGAGIRATFGNRTVTASHCIFAGNAAGGLISESVESSGTSCIFWMQTNPTLESRLSSSPLLQAADGPAFRNAPEVYLSAVSLSGDLLGVSPSTAAIPTGARLELADEGTTRTYSFVDARTLRLHAPPSTIALPASLTAFPPGKDAIEDYGLLPGSAAMGAALVPAGAPSRDSGVFGSNVIGRPGDHEQLARRLLRVTTVNPPPAFAIDSSDSIVLQFSEPIDPASVTIDQIAALQDNGAPIPLSFQALDASITITPLSGDWGPRPFDLQVHTGIRTPDDRPSTAALSLPFTTR